MHTPQHIWEEDELDNPIGRMSWTFTFAAGELSVFEPPKNPFEEEAPWYYWVDPFHPKTTKAYVMIAKLKIIVPDYIREQIVHVTLFPGIKAIPERAFQNCLFLRSISIPHSVTHIKRSAFCGCRSLESIIIPDSVTYIGEYAFFSCTSLTTVRIEGLETAFEYHVFKECTNLASIKIPEGLKYAPETFPSGATITNF